MVTWHLTMKLFPAKSHERATLGKLWRQTGNSSLLPLKCWPLLHLIAGISARFSNFAFVLFCYITNHLMTGPLGNSVNYYTSDSLWKIWLVESIQSIHNSLWTWHDKCNICCRYCIYHVTFNVCLVTKPLGVFASETKWPSVSLLFLRMNYAKNV